MDAPHVRLADLRAHHRLSPDGLGKRLGCTGQMVRFVEAGERSAGRDLVLSIEAFSRLPNEAGAPWPGSPLLALEWHHHKATPDAHEPDAPADSATDKGHAA